MLLQEVAAIPNEALALPEVNADLLDSLGSRVVSLQSRLPQGPGGMPASYIDPSALQAILIKNPGLQAPLQLATGATGATGAATNAIATNAMNAGYGSTTGPTASRATIGEATASNGSSLVPTDVEHLPNAVADVERIPNAIMAQISVDLDFGEGFPTANGLPFWERLDGELLPYYTLFKIYRDVLPLYGRRSIHEVARRQQVSVRTVRAISRLYHWPQRAAAFDAYRALEIELMRTKAIQDMQSKHSTAANKLFNVAVDYLESAAKDLDPKAAISLAELAVRLERLSYGMSPDKPTSHDESGPRIQVNQLGIVHTAGAELAQKQFGSTEERVAEIFGILARAGVANSVLSGLGIERPADIIDVVVEPAPSQFPPRVEPAVAAPTPGTPGQVSAVAAGSPSSKASSTASKAPNVAEFAAQRARQELREQRDQQVGFRTNNSSTPTKDRLSE